MAIDRRNSPSGCVHHSDRSVQYASRDYIKELDRKSGAYMKLSVLNPAGRVWTMVAGGGASVIYADTVVNLTHPVDDQQADLAELLAAVSNPLPVISGVDAEDAEVIKQMEFYKFQISMSRKRNPFDNAHVESFIKTLKSEEVHLWEYMTIEDVQMRIPYFIEDVYNQTRLHSALDYRPPSEFEFLLESTPNPCQDTLITLC